MKRAGILLAAALTVATQANAAHCPYGQLWRVHLNECVKFGTALALAYEPHRSSTRGQLRRIVMALPPPAPRETMAAEDPAITLLRERLAHPGRLEASDILLSRAAALEWR